jgi:peptide/nickel transport system ATP-binding protein
MSETKQPILSVKNIYKNFDISGDFLDQLKFQNGKFHREKTLVKAINGVSFDIYPGETVCMVGESGCGKSTVARTVMGLYGPNEGEIYFDGERIDNLPPEKMRPFRTRMQMIFQDPYASLNPRMKVNKILEEPVKFHFPQLSQQEIQDKIAEVMQSVGVDPTWGDRYPHEFSGGQRQRISIARALMVDPQFIVADEPIAALDVSIQAQILNLLMDAQEDRGLSYLFITHDLSVVEHIGTRVAVMYLGTLCELSPTKPLFENPQHPYTQALLSAIPQLVDQPEQHIKLNGEVPTPINLPTGCVFHGRCPYADERCKQEIPELRETSEGRFVACHAVEEGRINQ